MKEMCNEKFVVAIAFVVVVMVIFTVSSVVGIAIGPVVTNPNANPDTIPADGITTSELRVTVTESVVLSVTIDLSEIGGASSLTMAPIGDGVYSTTTTAPVGTAPGTYNLVVTATNIAGDSNTSVSIPLTVTAPPPPTPTPTSFIPGGDGGAATPTATATPMPTLTPSPQVTFTPPPHPATPIPTATTPTLTPTTPAPIPTATPPAAIPGFGILSAVIAVMSVFALSAVKRKRKR